MHVRMYVGTWTERSIGKAPRTGGIGRRGWLRQHGESRSDIGRYWPCSFAAACWSGTNKRCSLLRCVRWWSGQVVKLSLGSSLRVLSLSPSLAWHRPPGHKLTRPGSVRRGASRESPHSGSAAAVLELVVQAKESVIEDDRGSRRHPNKQADQGAAGRTGRRVQGRRPGSSSNVARARCVMRSGLVGGKDEEEECVGWMMDGCSRLQRQHQPATSSQRTAGGWMDGWMDG